MLHRGCNRASGRAILGLMVAATLAVTMPVVPAAAEGFLDFLFGGSQRRPPPPPADHINRPDDFFRALFGDRRRGPRQGQESVRRSADPQAAPGPLAAPRPHAASGSRAAFCVRLCDGHYFPIPAQRNASAAARCSSFCPASKTKIFSGREIEYATAGDGQRYGDLPNAFVYRQHLVPGCTCNGKTATGLAPVSVDDDPTLQPGDIVATNSGFTVYSGHNRDRQAAFTPIDSARVSQSVRNQLADVKVTPQLPSAGDTSNPASQDDISSINSDLRRISAREP